MTTRQNIALIAFIALLSSSMCQDTINNEWPQGYYQNSFSDVSLAVNRWYATQFTASNTAITAAFPGATNLAVSGIELLLWTPSTGYGTITARLASNNDSSNSPGATLASGTLNIISPTTVSDCRQRVGAETGSGSLSGYTLVTWKVVTSPAVNLTPGTKYWVIISPPSSPPGGATTILYGGSVETAVPTFISTDGTTWTSITISGNTPTIYVTATFSPYTVSRPALGTAWNSDLYAGYTTANNAFSGLTPVQNIAMKVSIPTDTATGTLSYYIRGFGATFVWASGTPTSYSGLTIRWSLHRDVSGSPSWYSLASLLFFGTVSVPGNLTQVLPSTQFYPVSPTGVFWLVFSISGTSGVPSLGSAGTQSTANLKQSTPVRVDCPIDLGRDSKWYTAFGIDSQLTFFAIVSTNSSAPTVPSTTTAVVASTTPSSTATTPLSTATTPAGGQTTTPAATTVNPSANQNSTTGGSNATSSSSTTPPPGSNTPTLTTRGPTLRPTASPTTQGPTSPPSPSSTKKSGIKSWMIVLIVILVIAILVTLIIVLLCCLCESCWETFLERFCCCCYNDNDSYEIEVNSLHTSPK